MASNRSITLSGVDEHSDLEVLARLDAEFGLLYTATPEGRVRYPSRDWIARAASFLPRVAIHICGRGARAELKNGQLDDLVGNGARIQVNGTLTVVEVEEICARYSRQPVITQHNALNFQLLEVSAPNHALLIDASGGQGILPETWPSLITSKEVGFAGGIGPDNLAVQLPLITEAARGSFWVDMEGSLRQDDVFSMVRAQAAVAAFELWRAGP